MENGEKLEEDGQHGKWTPVHGEHDAVLDSAVALQVEQLRLDEGRVYSSLRLQHSSLRLQHLSDFRRSHISIFEVSIFAFPCSNQPMCNEWRQKLDNCDLSGG